MDNDFTQANTQAFQGFNLDLRPGQLLDGRYKIIRELGRGGMGLVLEVENVFIHKKFAMKLIDMHSAAPSAVPRFQREAKLLSALEHPNLVHASDFGLINEQTPYVLMDLIEGQTLSQYLKERGKLSETEMFQIFTPLLSALKYAHDEGVVHRDLKPGNIMLVRAADGK